MAINPQLLVSAAVLQLYFVDKDTGIPLSNGIITFYQDQARTFLKNVYYQTGIPGAYTYTQAPNPLTLSAVGTPQDDNGNDIILFYYPFDENNENTQQLYYVTAFNSNFAPQWTRSGFPYQVANSPSPGMNPNLQNIIVNNVFWRNIGSSNISALNTVLAPGAHEGLTNPDIRYIRNVNDGTDTITFTQFITALPTSGVTPEYYCNFNCTGAGSSTSKVIQFPLNLHIQTLTAPLMFTVAIWIQNVAGNTANIVEIFLNQFLGTGVTSPAPVLIPQAITASNEWTRYILNTVPFPTAFGQSLSLAGDDANYLQISFPTGATTNINFTQPELYLGDEVADNSFDTYDKINSIVSSPRTGDIRTSLNTFSPFGWVPMNDGTIGSLSSGASTRANIDTFQLYSTIWNNVSNTYAPVSGMSGRGGSAYSDFVNNKTIALTKALGRSLIGLPTSSTFTYDHTTSLLTVADTTLYYVGSPITVSNTGGGLPPAFTAGTVYYVIPVNSTTFKLASSYANALAGTSVSAGASNGTGTQTVAFSLGGTLGQSSHVQLETELATHSHPGSVLPSITTSDDGTSNPINTPSGGAGTVPITVQPDGNSAPFNIVQPATYLNVFIKL